MPRRNVRYLRDRCDRGRAGPSRLCAVGQRARSGADDDDLCVTRQERSTRARHLNPTIKDFPMTVAKRSALPQTSDPSPGGALTKIPRVMSGGDALVAGLLEH